MAAFAAAPSFSTAVIAAPPGHEAEIERVATEAASASLAIDVVSGGATRAQSVGAGLAAVAEALVAVHDAARPLVTAELAESLLLTLAGHPDAAGVIAARPLADTVKRVRMTPGGPYEVERTESRAGLWAAETPQVFRTEVLRRAHGGTAEEVAAATDDAMLVERHGGTVLVQQPPHPNPKVTTAADLRLAERLLAV